MYEEFFGLTERPFSIAPDPQYLYMSQSHKEAMAHLSYGLSQGGGFIVLTGEVGTGKTTLCRTLLQDLPEHTDVALILNPNLDELELLQSLCDELKVRYSDKDSQKKLLDRINTRLLASFARNRQTVLIIDEAQLLSRDVLEQIRLLTNLETTKTKLLKIILIGQPELNDILWRQDMRQLAQRVTARYHLGALKDGDIEAYLNRRLSVAGCRQPVFTRQAIDQLRRATEGIPRRINVLADHSMLTAYAQSSRWVDAAMVRTAASEVLLPSAVRRPAWLARLMPLVPSRWWLLAGTLVLLNALLWWLFVGAQAHLPDPTAQRVDGGGTAGTVATAPLVKPNNAADDADEQAPASTGESPSAVESTPASNTTEALGSARQSIEYLDPSDTLPAEEQLRPLPIEPFSALAPAWFAGDAMDDSALRDLLATSANLTTRSQAFQRLAALWGYEFAEPVLEPYCRVLDSAGLGCLDVASWAELLVYNRPSIVVLSVDDTLHRAIVRGLTDDSVQLLIGDRAVVVGRATFEALWNGDSVALWRYSGFDDATWVMGDSGAAVLKAKQRIDLALRALGMPSLLAPISDEFDADTAQKLLALQSRFGLSADAELGAQTKVLINEVLGVEAVPRLVERVTLNN